MAGSGTVDPEDAEPWAEDPAAGRFVLGRVRFLAESCFLRGRKFNEGLSLVRFELVWLCMMEPDVKLVAKLIVGSAPEADSSPGSSSSRECRRAGSSLTASDVA